MDRTNEKDLMFSVSTFITTQLHSNTLTNNGNANSSYIHTYRGGAYIVSAVSAQCGKYKTHVFHMGDAMGTAHREARHDPPRPVHLLKNESVSH